MNAGPDPHRSTQKRRSTGTTNAKCETRRKTSQSAMTAVKAPPPQEPSSVVRTLTSENGIRQPRASAAAKAPPCQKQLKQPQGVVEPKAACTEYALTQSLVPATRTRSTQIISTGSVSTQGFIQTVASDAARVPPSLQGLKRASIPASATTLSPLQRSKRSPALPEATAPRPQKRATEPPVLANGRTPEKRLKQYRRVPTIAIRERINRVQSQQFFLVQRSDTVDCMTECDFVVLGSTGNVYTVRITQIPTCSCPDHAQGNLCKHILFVMLRVIGLDPQSPLVYQAAYLQSELQEMFALLASRGVGRSVMANDKVKKSYASLTMTGIDDSVVDVGQRSLGADSDCPICFDAMTASSESLSYCRAACGTNFHADCITRWLQGQTQSKPTCPNCRQPWDAGANKSRIGSEGYANLGALQGQSSERDTITYSSDTYQSPSWRRRYRR